MKNQEILADRDQFSQKLQQVMRGVAPVVERMEPYEFRYSLNNITPSTGSWNTVALASVTDIEKNISSKEFFDAIQIKPKAARINAGPSQTGVGRLGEGGLLRGEYPCGTRSPPADVCGRGSGGNVLV